MNKIFFIAIMALSTLGYTSCGTYNSMRDSKNAGMNATTMSKIGNILIQDLGASVLPKSMGTDMLSKLNMGTKLNTIIQGATMVSSFKNMLTNNYGISKNKVENAYDQFGTLSDVATFIGKNASSSFLSKL